jgi:hypothetical protein
MEVDGTETEADVVTARTQCPDRCSVGIRIAGPGNVNVERQYLRFR